MKIKCEKCGQRIIIYTSLIFSREVKCKGCGKVNTLSDETKRQFNEERKKEIWKL